MGTHNQGRDQQTHSPFRTGASGTSPPGHLTLSWPPSASRLQSRPTWPAPTPSRMADWGPPPAQRPECLEFLIGPGQLPSLGPCPLPAWPRFPAGSPCPHPGDRGPGRGNTTRSRLGQPGRDFLGWENSVQGLGGLLGESYGNIRHIGCFSLTATVGKAGAMPKDWTLH